MRDENCYDIVVIGGGPAGISAAIEAHFAGLGKVLLVEKGQDHSQTIRKYYKDRKFVEKNYKGQTAEIRGMVDFREGSKEEILAQFQMLIDEKHLDVCYRTEAEAVVKIDCGFEVITSRGSYRAFYVIISIGKMGRPNRPSYPLPNSLRRRIDFDGSRVTSGERILVIGGGNSAVEYAIDASTHNTVTLAYRKPSFTRLTPANEARVLAMADAGELELLFETDPVAVEEQDGLPSVTFNHGGIRAFDRLIFGIGGTTPVEFLRKSGVKMDDKKNPITNDVHETNVAGLYIAGDLAAKRGGSIAIAFNHSHEIVADIKKRANR